MTVVVQVGSSIEAIIVVSIVIVFACVGLYIWRVFRRASHLLQSISIRVRDVPVCISCDSHPLIHLFLFFLWGRSLAITTRQSQNRQLKRDRICKSALRARSQ
jgi:hypothetical protein